MADTQRRAPSSAQAARSRLRWTRQLHGLFLEAVSALGGAHKATPKSVKKEMGVPGLTLYHLKSHLQKFRLAMRQCPEVSSSDGKEAECSAQKSRSFQDNTAGSLSPIDRSMLQKEQEVQSRLDGRIEVQRRLQLRIEAQGRYLQTALLRAQEMLAGQGIDSAASDISEVLSATDIECRSSSQSFSGGSWHHPDDCSGDSSSTTWEASDVKHGKLPEDKTHHLRQNRCEDSDDTTSDAAKPSDHAGLHDYSSVGHSPRRRSSCGGAAEEIDLNKEPTSPACLILTGAPEFDARASP